MAKKSVEERLNEKISELEAQLESYREAEEEREYEEEWRWRHIRKLTDKQNLGLPLPRLEIRYRKDTDYEAIADYGLVIRHFLGHIEFIPIKSTHIGGSHERAEDKMNLPFRDGAHIKNEMKNLKMPGYIVNGDKFRKIELKEK